MTSAFLAAAAASNAAASNASALSLPVPQRASSTVTDYGPAGHLVRMVKQALPLVSAEWSAENAAQISDKPLGTSKHLANTLWVLAHSENQSGGHFIGAEVFRRAEHSSSSSSSSSSALRAGGEGGQGGQAPYTRMCELYVELNAAGAIIQRSSDWAPASAKWDPVGNASCLKPGIFVELFRKHIEPFQVGFSASAACVCVCVCMCECVCV